MCIFPLSLLEVMKIPEPSSPIKVLLVDDHTLFRSGLKMLLEKEEDIVLTSDVPDAEQAMEVLQKKHIDVTLMDIGLPGIDGIEAAQRIKNEHPSVKILMLSMHKDEPYLLKALETNANGYLVKESASTELVSAIHRVMNEEIVIHPSLTKVLVNEALKDKGEEVSYPQKEILSLREKEVLYYVCLGYTNQEIAEDLMVSVKTVEKHKANIMHKVNVKKRYELIDYAIKQGLVNLSSKA